MNDRARRTATNLARRAAGMVIRRAPHAALLLALLYLSLPLLYHDGSMHALHGQDVYTDLTEPAQIRVFNQISSALVCQCGCNFVLSSCPHVECPWGIPARRFIEARIRAGLSADEIIHKMKVGFGESARQDPILLEYAAQGRDDIVDGMINGWGSAVVAHVSNVPLLALVGLVTLSLGYVAVTWWKRNRRTTAAQKSAAARHVSTGPHADETAQKKSETRDWQTRLRDLDK